MKPTPPGWPRIAPALFYDEPAKAIDWLCAAFGFETTMRVEGDDGDILHSELKFGDGLIMVGSARKAGPESAHRRSPRAIGGANTQSLMLYVDDADAHCARARAHGAVIETEPKDVDYGDDYWSDRSYGAIDVEGHHWWFCQRLRDPVTK